MILSLLLLALASTAPVDHDAAGNRLEAFEPRPDLVKPGGPELRCTKDARWCAEISRDVDLDTSELHVFAGLPGAGVEARVFALEKANEEDFSLWPQVVRQADGVLVGVERGYTAGYSGGGGSSSELSLIRVEAGSDPKVVLVAPLSGSLMIRACFSEKDMKARRGACHDEYSFEGTLSLDPATASGPPRLVFEAEAKSFPAHRSRSEDSTTMPPLRQRDLAWTRDEACSFRRTLTLDPVTQAYVSEPPLPDCSDYTVP